MALSIIERLKLLSVFGAGNYDYVRCFGGRDQSEVYSRMLRDKAFDSDVYAQRLRRLSDRQFEGILNTCGRYGISIVTPEDDVFPERLAVLDLPPILLFVMGDISYFKDGMSVAVVGCREPAEYSLAVTRTFANTLAANGVAVVSGLARGIDTAAHTAALEAGGITAAVLGCGLLHDYPKGSMILKKRISERGAVISEYFPTALPDKAFFKVRNRLIPGLSDCVLVTEASNKSGSLNTATHAADQGREVFVIPPHDLLSERFAGQTELLADGASLALYPADIYRYIVERHDFY